MLQDRLLILILIENKKNGKRHRYQRHLKNVMNNNKEEDDQQQQQEQQRFNPLVIVQRDNEARLSRFETHSKSLPECELIFGVNAWTVAENLEDAEYGLQPLRIFNRENFKSLTWKVDDKRRNPDNLKGIQWIAGD